MVDSALDFIVLILVLGVCVAISFGLVMPMVNDSKSIYHDELYDKSVEKLEGDRIIGETDICVPIHKVVLSIMGQNYFMPDPQKISIGTKEILVKNSEGYSPNSMNIGNESYTAIKTWFNQFKSSSSISKLKNPPQTLEKSSKIVSGKEIDTTAYFTFMYDTHGTEDTDDDTYALYIRATRNEEYAEPEMFKCLDNGKLQSMGGKIL